MTGSTSGGGIRRGGERRSVAPVGGDLPDLARALRRRWATGVAVVTTTAPDGFRGITVSSLMIVSLDPPLLAFCPAMEGSFADLVAASGRFAVSILDRDQTVLADRFAARGPLPDAVLSGIRHEVHDSGLPVLSGALAWAICEVVSHQAAGDHWLTLGRVVAGTMLPDTDDPLLSYEGQYRGLEAE